MRNDDRSILALRCSGSAGTSPAPPTVRPHDAIAAAAPADWADVDPADLLLFEFDGGRSVVIQLAPQFAPDHIANIKKIVRTGHWANATIYRVADNWVTQWGAGEDEQERSPPLPKGVKERPAEEYSGPPRTVGPVLLSVDPYSQISVFALGWPCRAPRPVIAFGYAPGLPWPRRHGAVIELFP